MKLCCSSSASVAVLGPLHGGDSSPLAPSNTTSCTAPPSRPGAARLPLPLGQALCRFPHPCRFLLRPLVLQLSAPFKGVDTWWGPCQTQPHFLGHCRALAFFIEQHFLEGPGFQSPQEPLGAIPILFTYYPYRLSRAVITVPK